MSGYIHFTDEEKQRARSADLVSFLQSMNEPVKRSGSEYEWDGHHITIRENKWYDQYGQEGGSAIDFAMKYLSLSYPQAVRALLGQSSYLHEPHYKKPDKAKINERTPFALPEANANMRRVYAYLIKTRGIDRDVVSYFARKKLIYEDAKFHNAVFVGTDENTIPRHAHKKSTSLIDDRYRGNAKGSEAEYSFHHTGESEKVYVFEAPIDMLSFITLHKEDWQDHSYISLCSVFGKALFHSLMEHSYLRLPLLCLDNDKAGSEAAARIRGDLIRTGYSDVRILTPSLKDWNEDLLLARRYEGSDQAWLETSTSEDLLCMAYQV
jgi:hypothetical protein